jgi:O-antigen/teichoic acid export membrane protein
MFINLLLSYTFISSNNQKYIAQISIFAAFINVLLNIVLIKLYGYNGAAVSTLITELIVMVIGINWVNNKMVTFSHLKILKCPVISASFVYIFIFIIKMSNIIILAPFSIIIYLAILYFTGWVDNYDKMIIKKIIGK